MLTLKKIAFCILFGIIGLNSFSQVIPSAQALFPDSTDVYAYQYLGVSVDIDGDYAVVGASYFNNSEGCVYVLKKTENKWKTIARLRASKEKKIRNFGNKVAIDKDVIVVSGYGKTKNKAFVFKRPELDWRDTSETSVLEVADTMKNVDFPNSVEVENGCVALAFSELVLIYEEKEGVWNSKPNAVLKPTKKLGYFGYDIDFNSSKIAVGAINNGVFVYRKPDQGWVDTTESLFLAPPKAGGWFGEHVTLNNDTLVVSQGSYGEGELSGAVYVYTSPNETWTKMEDTLQVTLEGAEEFGYSCTMYGSELIVMANRGNSGIYVIESDNHWADKETLRFKKMGYKLPWAVSGKMAFNGSDLFHVNQYSNVSGEKSGSCEVICAIDKNWEKTEVQRILVKPVKGFYEQYFGSQVAVSGKYAAVSEVSNDKVYIYELIDNKWESIATLTCKEEDKGKHFGMRLSYKENTIIVSGNNKLGKVLVFEMPEGGWKDMLPTAELKPLYPENAVDFATSIDIGSDYIAVGVPERKYYGGKVYVYEKPIDGWKDTVETCYISHKGVYYAFGYEVSASGDYLGIHDQEEIDKLFLYKKKTDRWKDGAEYVNSLSIGDEIRLSRKSYVSDTLVVVGAEQEGSIAGKVFLNTDGDWSTVEEEYNLESSFNLRDGGDGEISYNNDNIVIGRSRDYYHWGYSLIYTKPPSGWRKMNETSTLKYETTGSGGFGFTVSSSDNFVFVGSHYNDELGKNSGRVDVFNLEKLSLISQPKTVESCYGVPATFTFNVGSFAEYQWQVSDDEGKTWSSLISESDSCMGVFDSTLIVLNSFNEGEKYYRCLARNGVTENIFVSDTVSYIWESTPPELEVKNYNLELINGEAILEKSKVVKYAFDNCSIADTILSKSYFKASDIGDHNVLVTLTDSIGLSVEKSIIVSVVENEAPILEVKDTVIELPISNELKLNADEIIVLANDNGEIIDTILSKTIFTNSDIGENIVDVFVKDNAGNETSKQLTLTVLENELPALDLKSFTLFLNENNTATLIADSVVAVATDNCSLADTTLSQSEFDCSHVGENTIQVTLSDYVGNNVMKEVIVTIADTVKPVLEVPADITVEQKTSGKYTVSGTEFDPTEMSDNCSYTISNNINDKETLADVEFADGNTTVTWTIKDTYGNTVEKSFVVTVNNTSGFEELAEAAIEVYPNPVENILHINSGKEKLIRIEVLNLMGQSEYACQLNTFENTIEIPHLTPNVYLVKIESESGVYFLRIVKK